MLEIKNLIIHPLLGKTKFELDDQTPNVIKNVFPSKFNGQSEYLPCKIEKVISSK